MSEGGSDRLNGCRVLVIEDEYFLADDLERILKRNGADVIGPVGERAQAMMLIDQDGFDVAVVDINLHDQTAYPLADELERQAIPFVFATGYSANVIPHRYKHIACWEKPFEPAAIVNELSSLCQRAAKKRTARNRLP
jgi:DNA-binding NtrC family response regulator